MKTFLNAILLCVFLAPVTLFAQSTVTGTVTDGSNSMPLPGVNVIVKGTTNGNNTDFDGKYSLTVNNGDVIVFSYIGFVTQEITYNGQATIDVTLTEDAAQLDEIVLIGYGSTTKKDATGSVDVVSAKDFNQGAIVSTDQLLNGKAAGVRITNTGGSPDSAPNIRIRGGSSLNAQNNPLIVIDGVPIGNDNPAGVNNPLALVNPNDIESFSILKDASATAIYGSRASNGVIIITTKKGTSGDVQYNFSTDFSVSSLGDGLDVMNADEFTRFIQEFHPSRVNQLGVPSGSVATSEAVLQTLNGRDIYNTNWRDAITRTATTSNTNFSARANLFDKIPFRGSFGYTYAEGVVKNDDYERLTLSVKLTPRVLNDNLKIDVNAKSIFAFKNNVDSGSAIGEALSFDPTKPVFDRSSNNLFDDYYLTLNGGGNFGIFQSNPLARLEQRERPENVYRFIGNVEFDYTLPFLPELRAVVNFGLDASGSKIEERFIGNAFETFRLNNDTNEGVFNPGVNFRERQQITNTTFDGFIQYAKDISESFVSKYDLQVGYSYQNFKNDGNQERFQYNATTGIREAIFNPANRNFRYYDVLNLQSYFARGNISILDRFLLTASIRADGSSLFTEDNRWGYFPAAALAWQIDEETFLENSNVFNSLKLRLSWGETGQQDITDAVGSFYPSIPLFLAGDANSQYFPNSSIYSAEPFNPNLTWEKSTTYNLGIDFSLFNNGLLSGSFDIYKRETTDLLAVAPVPPGQALTNAFVDNIGETESEGFELNLNIVPVDNDNFTVSLGGNLSYNNTEVTGLNGLNDINAGGSLRGTGADLLRHAVGEQAGSAFVFRQVYDSNGNPIPNAFVDLNGDNQITDEDRYYEQIAPNWTYGFNLNLNYKNWDLSSSFRGQIGGNVYNFAQLNYGWTDSAVFSSQNNLTNVLNFFDGSANPAIENVNGNIQFSDFYLEDATFLRCDNIALGYRFDKLIKDGSMRLYAAVTNPFIITDYTGEDPENFGGIDRNFYPRPTVYTFGVNIDF
ncbi:SusC/RagA family TonB-linked outer membrane protein [Winogradskyella haliclonae]|uniref:SusC/RagA family TonB-linked outer membrane protein n=1 Tax=Winogradskyella haliclonae TaxID=2048558 RepID=A0ABQ2BTQ1_9FLAO|nr:TonB-dependent receptor [Winogradskyella haliclonae]GGI55836.1 SusC/RagA family TonB-linked outer membrane protein [Winogradskyella haliclonae]